MKKYFVFIVVFFLIGGISAQAQFKFGLKAGVNMSSMSLDKKLDNLKLKNLTGFQVGPMIEATIPALGFGLDLAVLYSQQSFELPVEITTGTFNIEKAKMNTLQVPLNLKYKLGLVPKLLKVYGTAGPYVSFNLSNLKTEWKNKSFGAGLNFGLGVELLSHLQVGANYQVGLTNDYSSANLLSSAFSKGKPTTWSVTATYLF